jgi:hypothetical protein
MKIGVISDTHIPRTAEDIPDKVYEAFSKVDLILHAGDITDESFLSKLKRLAPVRAVCGNMDTPRTARALPTKDIIEAGAFRIGLTHGYGSPSTIKETVAKIFDNDKVDVIVFGHTHKAVNETAGGILYFNPGSPTDKFFTDNNSFGILEINDKIKGTIVSV